MPRRIAFDREARKGRATGVLQPQQGGCLVERLASGIVDRFAEKPVSANPVDSQQLRMAPRYQQGYEREGGCGAGEQGREEVTLEVVDANSGAAERQRQAVCEGGPHEQGSGKPRAGCVGDEYVTASPWNR